MAALGATASAASSAPGRAVASAGEVVTHHEVVAQRATRILHLNEGRLT